MTLNGWLQIGLFCLAILVCVKPLGLYMARLFEGERVFLSPLLAPVERFLYRLCGIRDDSEQRWTQYTCIADAGLLGGRLPVALPRCSGCRNGRALRFFNPQHLGAVALDLAFQHVRQLHHQHQLAILFWQKPPCPIWSRCWA